MGLASGTAQADHHCTNSGVCNNQRCPGQPLPFFAHKGDHLSPSEIDWDMNVCHWSFFDFGNHYGGVPVGAYGLKEGEPVAQWGCSPRVPEPPRRPWLVRWGGIELARGDDRPQRASAAPAVGAGTAYGGNLFGCRRTTCDRVGHGLVGGPDTKADVHQQTPTARSAIASRVIGTTGETAERTRRMLVESNLSRPSRLVESNLSQRQAIESSPAHDAPTVRQTLR
jgi:hypothetical protein